MSSPTYLEDLLDSDVSRSLIFCLTLGLVVEIMKLAAFLLEPPMRIPAPTTHRKLVVMIEDGKDDEERLAPSDEPRTPVRVSSVPIEPKPPRKMTRRDVVHVVDDYLSQPRHII